MAAIATRGELAAVGDYYLCPLPSTQLATGELESYLQPVWSGRQELTEVEYTYANGETKKIAVGYEVDEAALAHQKRMLGWRVYVTNQSQPQLSLQSAVVAYREEYLIERGFGRFKGFPLSLTPIYLQRDDYVKGLIRLLSIGLRVLKKVGVPGSPWLGTPTRAIVRTLSR